MTYIVIFQLFWKWQTLQRQIRTDYVKSVEDARL